LSKSKYLFFESVLPTSLDGWDSNGTPCEEVYHTAHQNTTFTTFMIEQLEH